MTNLNEVVAMHKGWKREKELQGLSVERDIWISPKAMFSFPTPPDYQGDARLYMALFEEMANTYSRIFLQKRITDGWVVIGLTHTNMYNTQGDTIGTAICLAYMRLHGLE